MLIMTTRFLARFSRISALSAVFAVLLSSGSVLLCASPAYSAAEPVRTVKALMLVGGHSHDYRDLPVRLADELMRRGHVIVEVTDDLARIDARTLAKFDVFIDNTCHRPALTDAFKQAVTEHVRSGKGLVVVHCSLWSYVDWPEWTAMIGGRVETHDKYGSFDVVVLDPTHATMLSLGNRFTITDEPYLVDQRDPAATVLIETAEPRHDTSGTLRPGPDPQVWVKRFGQGRIFVTTFGHDAASQQSDPFITLLHNGVRWAGGSLDDTVHNRLSRSEQQAGFALLFNGRDLTGFKGDLGFWTVEDGELVGRARDLTRCAFLMPSDTYGDFILRLSFKLVQGNSGVQFRSIEQPHDAARPLHGYHADIVPDAWGSLYDYGGARKVLAKELTPEAARHLVIANGWNDMTIQAARDRITVWVNGVVTARFQETDAGVPRSGLIGFQLHRGAKPTEIRLRDVRIRPLRPAELDPQTHPD